MKGGTRRVSFSALMVFVFFSCREKNQREGERDGSPFRPQTPRPFAQKVEHHFTRNVSFFVTVLLFARRAQPLLRNSKTRAAASALWCVLPPCPPPPLPCSEASPSSLLQPRSAPCLSRTRSERDQLERGRQRPHPLGRLLVEERDRADEEELGDAHDDDLGR